MKILIVNWKDPAAPSAGGSEMYISTVARSWAGQGHEVTMVVPHQSGTAGTTRTDGVTYVRTGNKNSIFAYARLYVEHHGHRFDAVLESVSIRPFFTHQVVGDRATALVYHVAGNQWNHEMSFPMNWVGRRLLEPGWLRRLVTGRVVTISPSTAEDLERHGIRPLAIVPPGCSVEPVFVDRRLTVPPRIVFVGRLVQYKRPHDAVRAFERISAAFPGASLDIVGGGYLEDRLRAAAVPGVRVHGYLSETDKRAVLEGADLMLLPGTREGWGIVAMEAAAFGVPVIAYDVNGLRDAVAHDHSGILVPATPDALANAAVDLLRDPVRWAAMSQAAQKRAASYTWARTAESLLQVVAGPPTVHLSGRGQARRGLPATPSGAA